MALRSVFVSLLIWFALVLPWAFRFQSVEPYMDEIFHVPQTQRYCKGNFGEWDSKITTFPGLYVLSALLSTPAMSLLPLSEVCSLTFLRAVNVLFGMGSLLVMQQLLRRRMSDTKAAAHAFVLALYPIHFFFTFLYYTDVGSLFWVLLTHHLATPSPGRAVPSRRRVAGAAVSGLVSIAFRQTNAVWLMFTFGTAALADLEASKKWGRLLAGNRGQGGANGTSTRTLMVTFAKALLLESKHLLRRLGTLLLPVVLFIVFVLFNGSVVVGDHSHHQAVAHWAQLAYLSAVTASLWGIVGADAAVSVAAFTAFKAACLSKRRSALMFVLAISVVTCLLHRYSFAHPFLLADNRHYTFHVWRRLLGRIPGLKEALSPVYVYSAWLCHQRLTQAQSELWFLIR